MEFLLALAALAIGLVLARSAYLDPDDYILAAALAVLLAAIIAPAIPNAAQARVLVTMGAPDVSIARAAFLQAHGLKIVLACGLFALGACAEAWLRSRRPYDAWN